MSTAARPTARSSILPSRTKRGIRYAPAAQKAATNHPNAKRIHQSMVYLRFTRNSSINGSRDPSPLPFPCYLPFPRIRSARDRMTNPGSTFKMHT